MASATELLAAPSAPTAITEPATWPDLGPYQKVGRADSGLGVIKLPVPVVAAIQRFVPDDPSLWNFFDGLHDFAGHDWHIVQLFGEHRGYITLLFARGAWTLLSDPASLPVLNEVLDPLRPDDLNNNDKAKKYLWHIVLLQRHGRGTFLDKEFQRGNVDQPRYELWTDGSKAQRHALRALCHDPIVRRSEERATVKLNVITMRGAVERWTFHLRIAKTVRVESTEIKQLYKENTFFYPLM